MNIKEAKRQVQDTVKAYLSTDDMGNHRIPLEKQRPLFLLGAPGIGKTALMAQVADEMGIGLVSYSMTHHTRQSALGLPHIVHRSYGDLHYDASEYTMSEIVAAIYDFMERTGLERGILFLDEINCVSETLYPSMLQFLQFKTFGTHRIPENWVVVCAGNPPEYNRSVHDFDIVTMDRLRKVAIDPDLEAWREYAVNSGMHPAVVSFLDVKNDRFYAVESTPEGKAFVTARGWEDLSQTMKVFDEMGIPIDRQLVEQFIQKDDVAEDFALYYELFKKYQSDYQVDTILDGTVTEAIRERAAQASFDERVALLGLLLDRRGDVGGSARPQRARGGAEAQGAVREVRGGERDGRAGGLRRHPRRLPCDGVRPRARREGHAAEPRLRLRVPGRRVRRRARGSGVHHRADGTPRDRAVHQQVRQRRLLRPQRGHHGGRAAEEPCRPHRRAAFRRLRA